MQGLKKFFTTKKSKPNTRTPDGSPHGVSTGGQSTNSKGAPQARYDINSVSARDFIGNIGTQIILQGGAGQSPEAECNIEECVLAFKAEVMKRSADQAKGGVADNYREKNVMEPSMEFTPKLRKINFYEGDMVPKKGSEGLIREYVKQYGFAVPKKKELTDESITYISLYDFLLPRNKERKKALVGQAGSGKTTLIKRLARDIASGRRTVSTKDSGGNLRDVECVHFLNVRDIPVSSSILPADLLFGKVLPGMSKDVLKNGFNWMIENQTGWVLLLDGLDQATWSLLGKFNKVDYFDRTDTSTIMYNVLSGNLFPHLNIILTSREHAIARLTGGLRPDTVVSLDGLTMDDRKELFIQLAGEDGKTLWVLFCAQSPAIRPLTSIPLFLVFVVIVYKSHSDYPPDTMTEIVLFILQIFMRSEHAQERQGIVETLCKLKKMSFEGLKEGRVLFTVEDLEKFDIIHHSVRDLVIFVPGSAIFSQFLLEGDYKLYFCHQSIQEMLAALHIYDMSLESFEDFIAHNFQTDHWSVVRRFLYGILLNERTHGNVKKYLAGDLETEKKRHIVKRWLADAFSAARTSREKLELMGCLCESNDLELIQALVKSASIEYQGFRPSDMYTLSSVLKKCSNILELRFTECYLRSESLEILESDLTSSSLKINKVEVDGSSMLGIKGFAALGEVIKHCDVKEVKIINCNVTGVEMATLLDFTSRAKIHKIDLSGNNSLGVSGFVALATIVLNCGVTELVIRNCTIRSNELRAFQDHVAGAKISTLDVSENVNMGVDGFRSIGEIASACHIKELIMVNCYIDPDEMHGLKSFIEGANITKLDLSVNAQLGEGGFAALGQLIRECRVSKLKLTDCDVCGSELRQLSENASGGETITKVLVQYGNSLRDYHRSILNEVLQKRELAAAMLNPDEFQELMEETLGNSVDVEFTD